MEYTCPNCKQTIADDEALLCMYCGESLKRSIGVLGRFKSQKFYLIVSLIVLLTLLGFLLLLI